MVLSAVGLGGSPHVGVRWSDRPKWSSWLPKAPHFQGRPDPRQASRRGRIRQSQTVSYAASSWLQRNGVLVFHMACRITAIFRATAILAFLNPDAFASFR